MLGLVPPGGGVLDAAESTTKVLSKVSAKVLQALQAQGQGEQMCEESVLLLFG